MTDIEKAKLYDVKGPVDKPERDGKGISVQFNPSSLKVTLANSLKENERSGNTRATQYVDKSSSSLSVELIFDTTLDWDPSHPVTDPKTQQQKQTPDRRKDVRKLTKKIAETYMFQPKVGDKKKAPKRCMFVWGSFAFVGVMESFDETLDFFGPEGTPLRSTVSIKMTESRFQFETKAAKAASRDTPTLGSGSDPVPSNWRDNAMYNGQESPRIPSDSPMSIPSTSLGDSLGGGGFGGAGGFGAGMAGGIGGGIGGGISGGVGIGGGASFGASASFSAGVSGSGGFSSSTSLSSSTASFSAPGFSFGASSSLGSGIPGAFSVSAGGGGLSAGSIVALNASSSFSSSFTSSTPSTVSSSGSLFKASTNSRTATGRATASASLSSSGGLKASGNIGFD